MLKNLLKKINDLPVCLTIKHYYTFGEITNFLKDKKLDSLESWNVLRAGHPHFSVSENREEWLKACESEVKKDGQDTGLIKRAKDVVRTLERLEIKSLFSVGVGGAGLEYQIKKIKPELKLICSEYSQSNVDLLKKVFWECDSIIVFDMTRKDWPVALKDCGAEYQICLIYRIDASFTDAQWKNIFQNMFNSGVQNILYIPTNFLTVWSFLIRIRQMLWWKISHQPISFAGYLRTKKMFRSYWRFLYNDTELSFGGLKGFLLQKNIAKIEKS